MVRISGSIIQCITGILEQLSEYAFEIIVSDDHSKDSTQNIIKLLALQNPAIIKYEHNEQNQGIVKNMSICIIN